MLTEEIYEKIFPMELALNLIARAVPTDEHKNNQIIKNLCDMKLNTPKTKLNEKLGRMTLEHLNDIGHCLLFGEATNPTPEQNGEMYRFIRGIVSVYGCDVKKIPTKDEIYDKFRLTYLAGNGIVRLLSSGIRKVTPQEELLRTKAMGKPKPKFWGLHILSDIGFQMNVKDDKWMDTNTLLGTDYGRRKKS